MGYRHLLTTGHFRKLWISQVFSLIAQNLLNYTLIIRVAELSQHTPLANISVALVILAFGVPSILFAAVAGVYVDTWSRKRVLFVSNFIRAAILLAYLFAETNLALVLILTFAVSTATQFFAPAEAAAIPGLVTKKDLLTANAMFVSTFYVTFIVGYVAAAPILQLFGSHASYAFAAALFGIATVLAGLLPELGGRHRTRKSPSLSQGFETMWRSVEQNFRVILANRDLYFPIAQLMFVQAIISVLLVFAPALSLALLKGPLQNTSWYLVLPAALGMGLGIVLVRRLVQRLHAVRIMNWGILAAGIGMLGIGLSGQLYRTIGPLPLSVTRVSLVVAALVFVVGFANAVVSVVGQTQLQESTPDETRGKVFGALNMMLNIALTLPVLIAAVIADLFSVTKVVSLVGIVVVAIAIAQVIRFRPLTRNA